MIDGYGAMSPTEEASQSVGRGAVRVLHVAESARGGVGTYLNQIVPELRHDDDGAGSTIVSRVVVPQDHSFMLTHVTADAISPYRRERRSVAALVRLAIASWREIRAFRPHVVHCHSTFAGLVVRPIATLHRWWTGVPAATVYSPHGWAFQINGSRQRQRLVAMVERLLATITDRIVVLSDAEKDECVERGFSAEKLVRIYNGIGRARADAPAALWDDARIKVFFVGRFDRQKGLDTLMEAARRAPGVLSVRCAGASVVDQDDLQETPANVELLGWLDEPSIESQLSAADVVAVPSRWEGFGLVAAEAMRAGLPVVASRVGGLPEVVEDGVTGRLVPPDDPAALLHALSMDDDETRRRMGRAAQVRFLAKFTADQTAHELANVYAEMLLGGALARPVSRS
jgi:glycosyltransferase involved in cell wall biosynthesis